MKPARLPVLALLCGLALAMPLTPARAADTAMTATPPLSLDTEFWAGISYRDALVGAAALGTGAAIVSAATGSTVLAVTAVAAVVVTYIVYDPGSTGVVAPSDLPTLSELRKRSDKQ